MLIFPDLVFLVTWRLSRNLIPPAAAGRARALEVTLGFRGEAKRRDLCPGAGSVVTPPAPAGGDLASNKLGHWARFRCRLAMAASRAGIAAFLRNQFAEPVGSAPAGGFSPGDCAEEPKNGRSALASLRGCGRVSPISPGPFWVGFDCMADALADLALGSSSKPPPAGFLLLAARRDPAARGWQGQVVSPGVWLSASGRWASLCFWKGCSR
jgi:hypothetical protein